MALRKEFLNPAWVYSRILARLTGADAKYWSAQANSFQAQLQLERAEFDRRLGAEVESRDRRLHPYVQEALRLLREQSDCAPGNLVSAESASDDCELGLMFTMEGSDKETRHSYSQTYEKLLSSAAQPIRILEVGLGSLNQFAYAGLPPGGSLRAWRKQYPGALVVGMDIDPESVAAVEPPAYVVDQTSDASLRDALKTLETYRGFDLIVDDGFHDPHANVRTMLAFFDVLKPGGFYVVEDIHESLIDFWAIISEHLPGESYVLDLRNQRPECEDNILFISRAPM